MSKKAKSRILAAVLMILGIVLGVTWNSTGLCVGDNIFLALGLPAWSNGTSGTHYPAILGAFLIMIGAGVLNTTFQKKNRAWVWVIVVFVLIVFHLISAFR